MPKIVRNAVVHDSGNWTYNNSKIGRIEMGRKKTGK